MVPEVDSLKLQMHILEKKPHTIYYGCSFGYDVNDVRGAPTTGQCDVGALAGPFIVIMRLRAAQNKTTNKIKAKQQTKNNE